MDSAYYPMEKAQNISEFGDLSYRKNDKNYYCIENVIQDKFLFAYDKNINNLNYYSRFRIDTGLKEIYKIAFANNDIFKLNLVDDLSDKNILDTANRLVHYGWKKEAIPITRIQKSLIARFFNAIFGLLVAYKYGISIFTITADGNPIKYKFNASEALVTDIRSKTPL